MSRVAFLMREALINLRRNLLVVLGAVLAVFISLALAFGALVVNQLLRINTLAWQDGVHVIAFLNDEGRDGVGTGSHQALLTEVQGWSEVANAFYIDKAQAWVEYKELFADRPDYLDIDPSVLPASVRIELNNIDLYRDVQFRLADQSQLIKRVVTFGEQIEQLSSLSTVLNLLGLGLAFVLGVSAVILIANTIRMAIYARRDEVAIMKLVGASNWFVRIPFILEGMIEGLVGAGLAVTTVWVASRNLRTLGETIEIISFAISDRFFVTWGILFLLFGAAAGVLGSVLGLSRYLRDDEGAPGGERPAGPRAVVKPARLTVLLVALAVLWGSAPVVAQDDPASELQQVQLELADITRAIKAARNEASAVGQQVAAAQANLESAVLLFNLAQSRVDETIARVHETEQALAALTTQLSGLEADLARTEIDLRATETRLEQQAVAMYMEASAMPAIGLFTQDDAVAAATVIVYAGDIFARNEETFTAFELLQREVERQRATVSGRRAEAQNQLAKLESEKAQLEAERNEANEAFLAAQREAAAIQSLLDEIRQDIAAAEEHKGGLEADAARLEDEIARLQSPEGEAPGVIGWPVNGRVSSPFGYRTHPILGVRKLHTGIDINGSTGTPISAAADGEVILSQTYGGYGRAVVIDHGGGMATLYAHQSSIAVSVGEVVTRGEVIGYVGCTGSCTGPHLHFEVRLNGVPVDPMQYLG